jgi:UDP-glucose 4-epimerase
MSKILILGDGILGSELQLQTGWDLVSRKTTGLNIRDTHQLYKVLEGYDTVINCIANTNTYSDDGKDMCEVNYYFPYYLAVICNELKVKLVQISTEYVYANNKGLPNEDSLPLPAPNWYSYYKLMADNVVSLISNSYLICRLLHKSKDFNPPEVWSVETSGDTVDKIAELVIKLIRNDAYGLYNVGTGSKWLSLLIKDRKCPIVNPPKGVPTDTRMDLTKMNNFLDKLNLV